VRGWGIFGLTQMAKDMPKKEKKKTEKKEKRKNYFKRPILMQLM